MQTNVQVIIVYYFMNKENDDICCTLECFELIGDPVSLVTVTIAFLPSRSGCGGGEVLRLVVFTRNSSETFIMAFYYCRTTIKRTYDLRTNVYYVRQFKCYHCATVGAKGRGGYVIYELLIFKNIQRILSDIL